MPRRRDVDRELDEVDFAMISASEGVERVARELLSALGKSVGDGAYGDLLVGQALASVSDLARSLSVEFVRSAREGGLPWTVIGSAFGISKQSASTRFA